MSSIEEAFDKAAEGQAGEAPKGQANPPAPTDSEQKPNTGQAADSTQPAPGSPPADKEKVWDGKAETLVDSLKQDPKAIQRAFTQKAMALAEAEKKLKGYSGMTQEEIKAFQDWKQQQEVLKQQQLQQQPLAPQQLSAEQFELVRNNPEALQAYVQSLINANLQQAAQVYGKELETLKYNQSLAQWEQTISAFGEVHPDMWEMHESGLFKPILDMTIKQGGSLEDAYATASRIRDAFRAQATLEAEERIKSKQDGASLPGVTSGADTVVFADNAGDALNKAFDLAFTKKEYVPKDATVRPTGRVRVKKK